MGVPQLNSCCCGCTLRKGTLIIGWLTVIGSIFMVAKGALKLDYADPNNPDLKPIIPEWEIDRPVLIANGVIGFFLAAMLLAGVYQNKPKLVYWWVMGSLVLIIINDVLNLVKLIATGNLLLIIGILLGSLIQLYFVLVVYSYYRENETYTSQPRV